MFGTGGIPFKEGTGGMEGTEGIPEMEGTDGTPGTGGMLRGTGITILLLVGVISCLLD